MERRVVNTINDSMGRHVGVTIKSEEELEQMRQAGRVVAATIAVLLENLRPGIRTKDLDAIAQREIKRLDAKPSFKGYKGFPATICTSINHEIVHGIPSDKVIEDGDIVSLDVGAIVGGFHGDSAVTAGVGSITPQAQALVDVTKEALEVGIGAAKAGNRIGDISAAVQSYVENLKYAVVREYVGHGIGRNLHEEPAVPNFGEPGMGPLLYPGMTIAIEPMVNIGTWKTKCLNDGWTVITSDGLLSAHFEHTIAITEHEPVVLTSL